MVAYVLVTAICAFGESYPHVQLVFGYIPFDQSCERWRNTKIEPQWYQELQTKITAFQDYWYHEAPLLLGTTIQDMVVLIHRPPQVMPLTVHGQEDYIHVSCVPWLRAPAPQPVGVVLSKLLTPWADGFVGHRHPAFEQQFLPIAVAQSEAIREPDPMADNFPRTAAVLVGLCVGRRGHAWLPIRGFV